MASAIEKNAPSIERKKKGTPDVPIRIGARTVRGKATIRVKRSSEAPRAICYVAFATTTFNATAMPNGHGLSCFCFCVLRCSIAMS